MWRETCEKFDQILEEYNDAGVVEAEGMKKLAYKAYLKCAETKASIGKDDIAEKLLTRSERFGKSDYRHAAIRRRIERDDALCVGAGPARRIQWASAEPDGGPEERLKVPPLPRARTPLRAG